MEKYDKYVVFRLDERWFAFDIDVVERIMHSVEVTALPEENEFVLGAINIHGDIVFVLNIRKLFHIIDKEIRLSDRFIIIKSDTRRIAVPVDEINDVVDRSADELIEEKEMLPYMEHVSSVIKLDEGVICMILNRDLEKFILHQEGLSLKKPFKEKMVEK